MKRKVIVTQSCPPLCDPMDCSLPGSSVHGILQARIWKWLPFYSPGDHPNPEIKPRSPALQVHSLPSEPLGKPEENEKGQKTESTERPERIREERPLHESL